MPSSPGTIQLEHNSALIPAVSTGSGIDHDVTPQLPSSLGTSQLGPNPSSIPAVYHNKDLKCLLCGKYLACRRNFKAHMASHKSGRLLCTVSVCHYSAMSQDSMDIHMRAKHPAVAEQREGGRSVIDLDGTPTLPSSPGTGQLEPGPPSIPNLDTSAIDHSGDGQCLLCGKYLASRQTFGKHMASHNSGRILCSISMCHFSTTSQDALDIHMDLKHPNVTNERKVEIHACSYCGRKMNHRRQLLTHAKLHDSGKFPCPIDNCSSHVMLTQNALDRHLDRDHGDAPDVWVTPRKSSHKLSDCIDGVLRVARFGTKGARSQKTKAIGKD